ncbi:MAG: aminotransferase class IV [Candidatus Omnitrophota bacterium]
MLIKTQGMAKEVVFFNGEFTGKENVEALFSEPGILSGLGVFETLRSYKGNIVYLNEHLNRLKSSCGLLGIKSQFSYPRLKEIIKKAALLTGLEDVYLRLTLWKAKKGSVALLSARGYHPYPVKKYKLGFSAVFSEFRQEGNSWLGRIKSTNRIIYELSLNRARKRGFDEAVILNNQGYICEASRSNLFLVKEGALFTPALESPCLPGITRKVVLDLARKNKIKTYETKLLPRDLFGADEAFLTNSLLGVMPLAAVQGIKIGRSINNFRLSRHFLSQYLWILKK